MPYTSTTLMLPLSESPPSAAKNSLRSKQEEVAKTTVVLHSPHLHFHLSPLHRGVLIAIFIFTQLLLLLAILPASLSPRLFLFYRHHLFSSSSSPPPPPPPPPAAASSSCDLGMIYVYDLPSLFNRDLLYNYSALSNSGFGPPAVDLAPVLPSAFLSSWFTTDQFALEVIFHHRLLSYRCRTTNPSVATAFYIPFYAGLALNRHLWSPKATLAEKDRESTLILDWLRLQSPYIQSNGSNHFITLGRVAWDFRRTPNGRWGSSFLNMPGMAHVTRLSIERHPWDDSDVGIPYPTRFHPRSSSEIQAWQHFVLNQTRSTLFSFAGEVRLDSEFDIRATLISQCSMAGRLCRTVSCNKRRCENSSKDTLELFLDSSFCLQPNGDSFTRRSLFDCMIAGAVPVVFWKESAYMQYKWYLPLDGEEGEWSVFVDKMEVKEGNLSVRGVLEEIGEARARRMRERVVELIPRLVYAAGEGMEDAFDVAVKGVLKRFRKQQRR